MQNAKRVSGVARHKIVMVALAVTTVGLVAGIVWAQTGVRSATILQSSTTVYGRPIEFPAFRNQFTTIAVEIAPGGRVGRHMHPVPVLVYVLEGELTHEPEGMQPVTYKAGQAFVEGGGNWHDAVNRGSVLLRFLAVFAGKEGRPLTVRS